MMQVPHAGVFENPADWSNATQAQLILTGFYIELSSPRPALCMVVVFRISCMIRAIKAVDVISTVRRKDLITSHAELHASQEGSPALQHSPVHFVANHKHLVYRSFIECRRSVAGACNSQRQQRRRGITVTALCRRQGWLVHQPDTATTSRPHIHCIMQQPDTATPLRHHTDTIMQQPKLILPNLYAKVAVVQPTI